MATSYLGQEGAFYAERKPTDYVDWSKIGKDLSDTLNAEAKKRTELKAQLDEENRKAINFLQEAPQGEHKGASEWTLEYGSNGSQYMLMLNKKLKSGELSVKDYTVCVQNMMDGAKNVYGIMKDYQTKFKEKMDRYKKNDSQSFELWINSQAEKYSDFTKSQVYIDPLTGRNSIAIKEKKIINGKEVYVMSENPTDVASVDALRNDINSLYDRFNVDGATDAYVNSLGKEIAAIRSVGGASKSGQIMSIEDITSRQYIEQLDKDKQEIIYNFKKAETAQINAMLSNNFNRLSVLTENMKFIDGKQVGFTYDIEEAKKNKNLVLMRKDPRSNQSFPDFENSPHGEEQMELSTEWVRQQARSKYDRVQNVQTYTEQTPRPPTAAEIEAGLNKKQIKQGATILGKLYSGNAAEIKEAIGYIKSTDPNIVDVQRTATGVVVYRKNEKTEKVEGDPADFLTPDGKPIGYGGFLNSITPLVLGVTDTDVISQIDRSATSKDFNPTNQTFRVSKTEVTEKEGPTKTSDYTTFETETTTTEQPVLKTGGGRTIRPTLGGGTVR